MRVVKKDRTFERPEVIALGLGARPAHRRAAHQMLGSALRQAKPGCLVGRVARVEGGVARAFANGRPYAPKKRARASLNAGISPPTDAVLNRFSQLYLDALRGADVMTLPYYESWSEWLAEAKAIVPAQTPWFSYDILRHPFSEDDPAEHWVRGLDDRRVGIVSPLRFSIARQLDRLDRVYAAMPEARPRWASVAIVQSPLTQWNSEAGGAARPSKTWVDHFERLCGELADRREEYDTCLLGCGGYGMPLAHFLKAELRKTAVVVGGSLQLLFGIRGNRWDRRPQVAGFLNDA